MTVTTSNPHNGNARTLRQRAGLDVTATAQRLGVHRSTYWRWERHDRAPDHVIDQMTRWTDPHTTPFAHALHELRTARGETITAFAHQAGVPPRTMRHWLTGHGVPRRGRLAVLAERTGGDLKHLDRARTATTQRHTTQPSLFPPSNSEQP